MNNQFTYPLNFEFKVMALNPQFRVTDARFQPIAYVKQKAFKLKEDISVYKDETQTDLQYKILADRWLDWSASYKFTDVINEKLGRIARKGGKSLFKAHYELFDEYDNQDLIIEEDSFFVRFLDGVVGEIPIINFFTGYMFNPKYNVIRPDGTLVAEFIKQKSMIGRKFQVIQKDHFEEGEEIRVLLGLMMMVFLERSRG